MIINIVTKIFCTAPAKTDKQIIYKKKKSESYIFRIMKHEEYHIYV